MKDRSFLVVGKNSILFPLGYYSRYLPKQENILASIIIPDSSPQIFFRFIYLFLRVLFSDRYFFNCLIKFSSLKALFDFVNKIYRNRLFSLRTLLLLPMLIYICFTIEQNKLSSSNLTLLYAPYYSPIGRLLVIMCSVCGIDFFDMQHGESCINRFYEEKELSLFCQRYGDISLFVRSLRRYESLLFLEDSPSNPSICFLPFKFIECSDLSEDNVVIICIPYTKNEFMFIFNVLQEMADILPLKFGKILFRLHPRLKKHQESSFVRIFPNNIDRSSVQEFSLRKLKALVTFQSSIIYDTNTSPNDIIVIRDINNSSSVYYDYQQSMKSCADHGCSIIDSIDLKILIKSGFILPSSMSS